MLEIIKQLVFENLDNAKENGCFDLDGSLRDATVDELIQDMQSCSADCEDLSADALRPYIKEWLSANVQIVS